MLTIPCSFAAGVCRQPSATRESSLLAHDSGQSNDERWQMFRRTTNMAKLSQVSDSSPTMVVGFAIWRWEANHAPATGEKAGNPFKFPTSYEVLVRVSLARKDTTSCPSFCKALRFPLSTSSHPAVGSTDIAYGKSRMDNIWLLDIAYMTWMLPLI